jgi:hypothetical protein
MKPKLKFTGCFLLALFIGFNSCKRDNDITVAPPLPAKSTINFHIKDSSMLDWGEPVYLSRLVFTSYSNEYDSGENIFLRSNIDTIFSLRITGNTNNLFTVGGAPFDGVLIYKELKFILAGSNVNWEIIY